jgi:MFS family permease
MHKQLKYLLALAFVEGGAVMAVELVSAKLIGPFFGTSLYVWASVLGVTMAGLAGGYFTGGLVSSKDSQGRALGLVLALAGLLIALMPFTGSWVMGATLQWDVRWGSLTSCLVYLLPPVWLLGMVSPLLIRRGTADPLQAGRVAGLVYAISTLGGILITFLLGFYGMSRWGLRIPLLVTGGALVALALLVMALGRKRNVATVVVAALAMGSLLLPPYQVSGANAQGQLLYSSEGMGGQLEVREQVSQGDTVRSLFLNRLNQTSVSHRGKGCSTHPYVYQLSRLAAMQPQGARCLLLGMGGGTLLGELIRLGHQVEGCELDERMLAIAEDYYGIPMEQADMQVADARVCINQMQGSYDLVFVDVHYGDNSHAHVLTIESLSKVREHLTLNGALAILFPGPVESPHFEAMVHTLHQTGFQVALLVPDGFQQTGKILVATHQAFTPSFFTSRGTTPCADASGLPPFLPAQSLPDPTGATLLTDEVPVLEQMLLQHRNLRAQQ